VLHVVLELVRQELAFREIVEDREEVVLPDEPEADDLMSR